MVTYFFKILSTTEEMLNHYELVMQMGYKLTRDQYKAYLEDMISKNYKQMALFDNDACVALAGFWISTKLYSGKYVELDNVIVDKDHRNKSYGSLLCKHIEEEARKQGCTTAMLDAYVENFNAHRFYYREGYIARGYHFLKKL